MVGKNPGVEAKGSNVYQNQATITSPPPGGYEPL